MNTVREKSMTSALVKWRECLDQGWKRQEQIQQQHLNTQCSFWIKHPSSHWGAKFKCELNHSMKTQNHEEMSFIHGCKEMKWVWSCQNTLFIADCSKIADVKTPENWNCFVTSFHATSSSSLLTIPFHLELPVRSPWDVQVSSASCDDLRWFTKMMMWWQCDCLEFVS